MLTILKTVNEDNYALLSAPDDTLQTLCTAALTITPLFSQAAEITGSICLVYPASNKRHIFHVTIKQ